MLSPQFWGIFCDDVRHEIGGKYTLVGCYGTHMGVPHFPFTMSKLCFSFTYTSNIDSIPENIKVSIHRDDKSLFNVNLSIDAEAEADSREETFTATGGFEVPNLTFDGPCLIATEAMVDGEKFKGPTLRVEEMRFPPQH
ncbi:hypothetical protein AUP74_01266 [Microbulbifer aggregans]|uniref:Uncharacterized protein n=1 Tax=Microbulbifer aggregans TaxID=1769779 RepID=A0A1C9W6D3_9GAMM|nr:hypothetical protein [Microbulbifer aggregans]AOS96726.1 hypothetical protein AUP74_01266 [Microbulbifer aggregans]